MNSRILQLVESVIGTGHKKSRDNYAFYCPFCNHKNPKLEVALDVNSSGENNWHCWVCNSKGKTLFSLFRRLKVGQQKTEKLRDLMSSAGVTVSKYTKSEIASLTLPKEYKPLWIKDTHPEYRNALRYLLQDRGLTPEDILKYRIGYSTSGEYANKIIIPSYDANGDLNFFTARSYYDVSFKHKNPAWSKNIVGFELFVNWKLPITICEGAFDAMAIKRNAIPLFGKIIPDALKLKIMQEGVKTIYIALDKDAQRDALEMVQYFIGSGITVHMVDMQQKDPSELGFDHVTKLMKTVEPITFQKIMQYKLSLI